MITNADFSKHDKLLWSYAHRAHLRCFAAGAKSVRLEDLYGECVVAWCRARDAWDEAQNVPFIAFLTRGCWDHLNAFIKKELKQVQLAPLALDAEMGDDAGAELHEAIADPDAVTPEDAMILEDLKEFIKDPLRMRKTNLISRRTREFLTYRIEPPIELLEMLKALQSRAEYARNRGLASAGAPRGVTSAMVFDLMGACQKERTEINDDVKTLLAEINQ